MLAIEGIFYRFYETICRHREFIVLLKCGYLLEKKRLHIFIKPQLLNLPNFQPDYLLSSSLGFDLHLILSA